MKTAVITGASRGIGKAVAERLSEEGFRLILNCRSEFGRLDSLAEMLSEKTECHAIHGEINEEVLAEKLRIRLDSAEAPEEELLLVNNGGISRFHLAQELSDADFSELLNANLGSMFRTCRAMIPYMLKSGHGRIINISSVWGICGASMETVYSLTKGGINAFSKALAKELAPSHIPVNVLAPGAVATDMNAWMTEEERKRLCEEIPYGRMAEPEELAETVFLMTKLPSYLTGQIIAFDGGWI